MGGYRCVGVWVWVDEESWVGMGGLGGYEWVVGWV